MIQSFKILIFIGLILSFSHCAQQKKNILNNQLKKEMFQFTVEKEFLKGNQATFVLLNTGNKDLTVYSPWLKNIEKYENESWRKIRILYCPCGAFCDAPPEKLLLKPGEKHTLFWNLNEGWCDKKMQNGIPESIEKFSGEGLYRIGIEIELNETKKPIYKEFSIIKQ